MTRFKAVLGALMVGLVAMAVPTTAKDSEEETARPTVVVGTFDSRAVAIAYVRSEAFSTYVAAQKVDVNRAIERAKAAGDHELVAELSALGPAMQKRIHRQGFGTASVDAILARIKDEIPSVAKEAKVDVIVSKWALTHTGPYAKFVDVTDLIVAKFDPNEATLKTIREIVKTKPVPLDELKDDH